MSASRRFPRSRFQPGIAAMYACTGASPSAFAICGLPPERSFTGLASLAPDLASVPAFGVDLDLVTDLRGLLARDAPLASGFALFVRATGSDLPSSLVDDLGSRPRPLLFGFSAMVH